MTVTLMSQDPALGFIDAKSLSLEDVLAEVDYWRETVEIWQERIKYWEDKNKFSALDNAYDGLVNAMEGQAIALEVYCGLYEGSL